MNIESYGKKFVTQHELGGLYSESLDINDEVNDEGAGVFIVATDGKKFFFVNLNGYKQYFDYDSMEALDADNRKDYEVDHKLMLLGVK